MRQVHLRQFFGWYCPSVQVRQLWAAQRVTLPQRVPCILRQRFGPLALLRLPGSRQVVVPVSQFSCCVPCSTWSGQWVRWS
jgi:hypothetical protein